MRDGLAASTLAAALLLGASVPAHADITVVVSAASMAFHDDGWRPQRTLSPMGLALRWNRPGWPVDVETRLHSERTREQNTVALPVGHVAADLSLGSISAGIVKGRRSGTARPFAGGGLEALFYRRYLFDNDFGAGGRVRDGGVSAGVYASGGVTWRLGRGFVIGFEGRLFAGSPVTLTAIDVTPGVSFRLEEREESSFHREIALRLGWHRASK